MISPEKKLQLQKVLMGLQSPEEKMDTLLQYVDRLESVVKESLEKVNKFQETLSKSTEIVEAGSQIFDMMSQTQSGTQEISDTFSNKVKALEERFKKMEGIPINVKIALSEFSDEMKETKSSISYEIEKEVKARTNSIQDSVEIRNIEISKELRGIEERTKYIREYLSKVEKNLEDRMDKKSEENAPLYLEIKKIYSIISGLGGGNMNRQEFVNGVDPLTRYTDINWKAGTGITISATNNDITKKVDVTVTSTATGGITSINTDTTAAQTLTTGTSGTDFAIVDNGTGDHKFNLPVASASNTGKLSNTDWSTFNGKFTLPSLTSGSVLFSNGSTIVQDNANFFWDDTNKFLGLGTNSPVGMLDISVASGQNGLTITNSPLVAATVVSIGPSFSGLPNFWADHAGRFCIGETNTNSAFAFLVSSTGTFSTALRLDVKNTNDTLFSAGGSGQISIDAVGVGGGRWVLKTDGSIGYGVPSPQARLHIAPLSNTATAQIIMGAASQSGDLLQFQNSSTTVLSSISATGNLGIGSAATTTSPVHFIGLPTSSAGLVTGDVWCDTTGGLNILKIV